MLYRKGIAHMRGGAEITHQTCSLSLWEGATAARSSEKRKGKDALVPRSFSSLVSRQPWGLDSSELPVAPSGSFAVREKAKFGARSWLSWLSDWLLTSVQAMILQFVGLSPASGSPMTALSQLGILSLPVSLCPSPACALSLSKNK